MNSTSLGLKRPKRPLASQKAKEEMDALINYWRKQKAAAPVHSEDELIACCYIDAFQSVRKNLFYETLPESSCPANS